MSVSSDRARRNQLLRCLSDTALARLLPDFQVREVRVRDRAERRGEPIQEFLFPLDCVLSTIASGDEDGGIEVATVGNEGMSGVPVFLGLSSTETLETFAQVPGEVLTMRTRDFRAHVRAETEFATILGYYVQALLSQIAQASACNRLHPAEERCARWLLQSHDRVGRDQFQLTQEFIAQMLGLRRATVTEIAGKLQQEGLIEYSRGVIRIIDRPRLEERSCECYRIIRDEYSRLLQPPAVERERLTSN